MAFDAELVNALLDFGLGNDEITAMEDSNDVILADQGEAAALNHLNDIRTGIAGLPPVTSINGITPSQEEIDTARLESDLASNEALLETIDSEEKREEIRQLPTEEERRIATDEAIENQQKADLFRQDHSELATELERQGIVIEDLSVDELNSLSASETESKNEGGLTSKEIAEDFAIQGFVREQDEILAKATEDFQSLLTTQETQEKLAQDIINTFLSEGGVLDQIALGQIGGATSVDDALRIAQDSIARRDAQIAEQEALFQAQRQELADFTLEENQRALEQSERFALESLQRAGVPLQSGALADIFAEKAADLERNRQNFLANVTREDFLQGRDLNQLFSQQARDLALSESAGPRNALESLFQTRLGTTREDILGGRQFQRGLTAQNMQNLFESQEASRERQFKRDQQQRLFDLATQLAGQERKAQRTGALFGLGGAGLGAGLGALFTRKPGGFNILQGGALGAGIGQTVGGGFGGLFGGTAPTQKSPFFNIFDILTRK